MNRICKLTCVIFTAVQSSDLSDVRITLRPALGILDLVGRYYDTAMFTGVFLNGIGKGRGGIHTKYCMELCRAAGVPKSCCVVYDNPTLTFTTVVPSEEHANYCGIFATNPVSVVYGAKPL